MTSESLVSKLGVEGQKNLTREGIGVACLIAEKSVTLRKISAA
jgi:hypothetical protein